MFKFIKKLYTDNPLRFITYSVVGLIAFLILVIVIGININQYILNSNHTEYKGSKSTIVITGSMEPVIRVNSIVKVEYTNFEDIDLDDIIRFYNPDLGYSVMHRVVALGDNYLITKGDNNSSVDAFKVTKDNIQGKVIEIHNEYADVLSVIFGRFNIDNISLSLLRILIGFVASALLVSGIALLIYYIFDFAMIDHFWLNKQSDMQDSIDWLDQRVTKDNFNSIVDSYRNKLKSTKGIKKLMMKFRFLRYYDIMCTEEKEAKRVIKYRKKLEKYI